ncbi:hypothetical protein N9D38_05215 [Rubripirellula sp.]|nr:hypothetical protein [Rubripirellula sp.]
MLARRSRSRRWLGRDRWGKDTSFPAEDIRETLVEISDTQQVIKGLCYATKTQSLMFGSPFLLTQRQKKIKDFVVKRFVDAPKSGAGFQLLPRDDQSKSNLPRPSTRLYACPPSLITNGQQRVFVF